MTLTPFEQQQRHLTAKNAGKVAQKRKEDEKRAAALKKHEAAVQRFWKDTLEKMIPMCHIWRCIATGDIPFIWNNNIRENRKTKQAWIACKECAESKCPLGLPEIGGVRRAAELFEQAFFAACESGEWFIHDGQPVCRKCSDGIVLRNVKMACRRTTPAKLKEVGAKKIAEEFFDGMLAVAKEEHLKASDDVVKLLEISKERTLAWFDEEIIK